MTHHITFAPQQSASFASIATTADLPRALQTKWIALSGGPSSGKSSLVRELSRRGLAGMREGAVAILLSELRAGNAPEDVKTRGDFSARIAARERRRLLGLPTDRQIVWDTTAIDHLAYDAFYNRPTPIDLRPLCKLIRFGAVFSLAPLPHFEATQIRTETAQDSRHIAGLMQQQYEAAGYTPIVVPGHLSVTERADFVFAHHQFPR